mmetsp:Transcript_11476/g.34489  ORF Transcript_11476/g.34489 Transcript_11476/m.34489 type:complete len:285 (-) Transcript_11476:113-967(-)
MPSSASNSTSSASGSVSNAFKTSRPVSPHTAPRLARRCSARRRDASSAVRASGLPGMLSLLLAARDATVVSAEVRCCTAEVRRSTLSRLEPLLERDMRLSNDLRICLKKMYSWSRLWWSSFSGMGAASSLARSSGVHALCRLASRLSDMYGAACMSSSASVSAGFSTPRPTTNAFSPSNASRSDAYLLFRTERILGAADWPAGRLGPSPASSCFESASSVILPGTGAAAPPAGLLPGSTGAKQLCCSYVMAKLRSISPLHRKQQQWSISSQIGLQPRRSKAVKK